MLELLDGAVYARLEALGARSKRGCCARSQAWDRGLRTARRSMLTLFFHAGPVRSWADATTCDTKAFASWHGNMLSRGLYWPPSQYEAAFLSTAHSDADIDRTVQAAEESLAA